LRHICGKTATTVDAFRGSVWKIWFSVVIDGRRLNAVGALSPNISRLNAEIALNATSELTAVDDDDDDDDDDVSVDACLVAVVTRVLSLRDFEYMSRIFTDAYRDLGPGTTVNGDPMADRVTGTPKICGGGDTNIDVSNSFCLSCAFVHTILSYNAITGFFRRGTGPPILEWTGH